ncbi:Saccharopine dehydrogenase-domain-containing protein [Fomitopsis serialis]|uniref:Saccharopine dehydrogenase-domain-containing protein n=1 Tax=Fomitopsis serialis TaxID=139415 RepID=UPI0020081922|nr:Saccharopine dehydrogenase-domain-containing protein [Neoantrodia serialis]KAH9916537.1 Saccharopine dehydrogenase-domain-containing protein [Neoantrodia serialis]
MAILRRSPLCLLHRPTARHASSHAKPARLTIGIRREDPLRIWERRCPLTPDVVNELVERDGVDVLVEECDRRVWKTEDFVKAGARLAPTLSAAHITLGIKETPLHEVLNDPVPSPTRQTATLPLTPRTHLMFSHTIKGQMYNMELLSKFVSASYMSGGTSTDQPGSLPRLIDYELLTGEDGKRTVGFGWFAGVAGALESLNALAHAHLELGVASPFLYTPRPHAHPTLASIRTLLRDEVGARIIAEGTPKSLGPIVFGVTGSGKVAQGVLDLLKDLPIELVKVDDLPALVSNPDTDLHKVYLVHALPQDYFVRKDRNPYSRSDYYANPDQYESVFHDKIAPYLSLLLHGAGWAPNFPRIMSNAQLITALEKAQQIGRGRFACVGDISCDIEGGLEFLPHASTLSAPFFSIQPSPTLPPVAIMAVDILPTALPLEASEHFSNVLAPYLRTLIDEYRGLPNHADDAARLRRAALERATVAKGGQLSKDFEWLKEPLGSWAAGCKASEGASPIGAASEAAQKLGVPPRKKRVLMLGSGMVAGPAIEAICRRPYVELVVASNVLSEAERQTAEFANGRAVLGDMQDPAKISRLVEEADVVISLLPAPFHPSVAKLCIQHEKHLITASYISPDMAALHEQAVAADVVLLNEIGLDPGIDHLSAMSLIDRLKAQGKRVTHFTSFCGGLPAPEAAMGVPLGYKFSWSPRGVLVAALNAARFKVEGEVVQVHGEDLLTSGITDVPISDIMRFEGLPNRDSLPYARQYGLGDPQSQDLQTIFRGTLRYPGFSTLMHGLRSIGLLENSTKVQFSDWTELVRKSLEVRLGRTLPGDEASVLSALRDISPSQTTEELIDALRWFSLLSPHGSRTLSSVVALPSVPSSSTPLDAFALLLADKLKYQPHERDMVVLSHEIVASSPLSLQPEVHTSSLVAVGDAKASAMARCVGLPVAFAALHVLDGGVKLRGVHGPTDRQVYEHMLPRLDEAGLGMKESVGTRMQVGEALRRQYCS